MSVIILDLEWNSGLDGFKLNEILQIGAVKLDSFGGRVTDTFSQFVKPTVHSTMGVVARTLGLPEAELDRAEEFPAVAERFWSWCGPGAELATWGANDFHVLRENIEFWSADLVLPDYCDLQAAFRQLVGARQSTALHEVVSYCGFPDALDFHDALNDAFYAAAVGEALLKVGGPEALVRMLVPQKLPVGTGQFLPPQALRRLVVASGRVMRGFQRKRQILNGVSIREQTCPVCGSLIRLSAWYPLPPAEGYLSHATCPTHGDYYFYVSPQPEEGGGWCGQVYCLANEGAAREAYLLRDKKHVCFCGKNAWAKRNQYQSALKRKRSAQCLEQQ